LTLPPTTAPLLCTTLLYLTLRYTTLHYHVRSVLPLSCATCRPSIFLWHGLWVKNPSKKTRYSTVRSHRTYTTYQPRIHTHTRISCTCINRTCTVLARTFRNVVTLRTLHIHHNMYITPVHTQNVRFPYLRTFRHVIHHSSYTHTVRTPSPSQKFSAFFITFCSCGAMDSASDF
jgi:hypothetical protein